MNWPSLRNVLSNFIREMDSGTSNGSFKQEWIRKAKLERLRIYVSAQNILTITGIDDYDPEKYGTDTRGHAYPNAKTFSVGLNITL